MGHTRAPWVLIGLVLGACAAPRRDWQRGEWVVATDLAQPGARANAEGHVVGADAELLREVARETDRVLVWRRVGPERALELLETGRADVGLFSPEAIEAWGERADRLPARHADLGWRLTPARAGALEEMTRALELVR